MSSAVDPFAAWVLSISGVELPLSVEHQALLVEVLGVYVLFSLLLLLLLFLYGLGACWEGSCARCCLPHSGDSVGFLILDEKTDLEQAAFKALAKAELIDGTPRLTTPNRVVYDYAELSQPHFDGSPTQPTPVMVQSGAFGSPASARRARGPFEPASAARSSLNGKTLPEPQGPACVPTGAPSVSTRFADPAGVPSANAPYSAMHSDCFHEMQKSSGRSYSSSGRSPPAVAPAAVTPPRLEVPAAAPAAPAPGGSTPGRKPPRAGSPFAPPSGSGSARAGSPAMGQLSSRRGTPRQREAAGAGGMRDKDSPSWYGV